MTDEQNQQPQQPDEVPNAVVIVREFAEDGGVGTRILLSGDVKPTEVGTIIELGLRGWREQIGL